MIVNLCSNSKDVIYSGFNHKINFFKATDFFIYFTEKGFKATWRLDHLWNGALVLFSPQRFSVF